MKTSRLFPVPARFAPSAAAFTLLEIVTTLSIIVILTSIVVGIAGHAQRKGATTRAANEMAMLSSALENYKSETGGYPQSSTGTDVLSPKTHFNPTAPEYAAASLFLYQELTGDKSGPGGTGPSDGVPDTDPAGNPAPIYLKQYDPRILMAERDPATRRIVQVKGLQDPWGYSYGYSTAGMAAEQKFQQQLKTGAAGVTRPTGVDNPGFNSASPDLWSTTGGTPTPAPTVPAEKDRESARWVKNW